jgi:uncharacterized protein
MFAWDEPKRKRNISKHGIDFESVWDLDWENALRIVDSRKKYGEDRFVAFVNLGSRLHVCVYTPRHENYRIISLRKAKRSEVEYYEEKIDEIND